MISLCLFFSIILIVVLYIIGKHTGDDLWEYMMIIPLLIAIFSFIGEIVLWSDYANVISMDSEIEVYEQENVRIKSDLEKFFGYELYEGSDIEEEIVQEQIQRYYENEEKLTALRLEKAKGSKIRWLLFFGR